MSPKIFALFVFVVLIGLCSKLSEDGAVTRATTARRAAALQVEARRIEAERTAEAECRQDLQCWGEKHLTRAEIVCMPVIVELVRFDYEWTDGFRYRKFDTMQWLDRAKGTLGYNGRRIKVLDAFGYWHPMSYWCQYDPATRKATAELY